MQSLVATRRKAHSAVISNGTELVVGACLAETSPSFVPFSEALVILLYLEADGRAWLLSVSGSVLRLYTRHE